MTPHACPVCYGHGRMSNLPPLADYQPPLMDDGRDPYPCRACNGTGIVACNETRVGVAGLLTTKLTCFGMSLVVLGGCILG